MGDEGPEAVSDAQVSKLVCSRSVCLCVCERGGERGRERGRMGGLAFYDFFPVVLPSHLYVSRLFPLSSPSLFSLALSHTHTHYTSYPLSKRIIQSVLLFIGAEKMTIAIPIETLWKQ